MAMINTLLTVHDLEMGLNTNFDIKEKDVCRTEKQLASTLIGKRELDKVEYKQPNGSLLTCALYSVGSDRAFLDIYRQSHGELIRANIYKVVPW